MKPRSDDMLSPCDGPISSLAVVFAHLGKKRQKGTRIYSIAAAVLEPGNSPREFATHVCYDAFGARERHRSGLSRQELAQAPDPAEASAAVSEFLSGHPFLLTLVPRRHHPELLAFCRAERCVDLGFAAEFFLPQLDAHTPKRLWEHVMGKPRRRVSFSAAEMVELGTALVRHIAGQRLSDRQCRSVPVLRFFLDRSRTLFGEVFVHAARRYREYFGGLFDPCTLPDTGNWQAFLPVAEFASRSKPPPPAACRAVPVETVEERFRSLADADTGFQYRPSQAEFAAAVATAFNEGQILCLEAGTGTGKTQGYLIPSLEFLRRNPDARVVISTYTKSLQEQIFQREITFSREKFRIYADIPYALLKGKSSYVCAEKLDYTYEEGGDGRRLLVWLYLLNTVLHFPETDLDAIGARIREVLDKDGHLSQTLALVSARTGCTVKHRRCPAQVATARAQNARLVITNHHKLALMDQDSMLNGLFPYCIIDEANHFEAAVRGAFRTEADSAQAVRAAGYLERSIYRFQRRAAGEAAEAVETALQGLAAVRSGIDGLRDALTAVMRGARRMEEVAVPAEHPRYRNGQLKRHTTQIGAAAGSVRDAMEDLLTEERRRQLKIVHRTAGKIRSELRLLTEYAENLVIIGRRADLQGSVLTCFLRSTHFTLSAATVEVGELISENIHRLRRSIVYTAATLRYKGRFDAFAEIVGLDWEAARDDNDGTSHPVVFKTIGSPFDDCNRQIVVPDGALNGKYSNKAAWLEWVVGILPGLIRENRGRTLVLFSSYSDLQNVAGRIESRVLADGFPLLVQRPGMPTVGLCEEFRSVHESVLLGVDTFWYGVDFKGDTLTQVIITRIPYPSPRDPVQQARRGLLEADRYWRRYHYDKQIKLQQGIGRLIRSDRDRGRVVILDARYRPE